MGTCLSRSDHIIEVIQLKEANHGPTQHNGAELQQLSQINDSHESHIAVLESPPSLPIHHALYDQIEVEEILIASFYLSGNLKLYLLNKQMLLDEFKDIIQLISTSKVEFCGFLYRKCEISNTVSIKIYEFLQSQKNELHINYPTELIQSKSLDVDDIDESRLQIIAKNECKELNIININFSSGRYDQICQKYEVTLNETEIKSFNPKTNQLTLRIDEKNINKFTDFNIAPTMRNPLVVLLGISEFKQINCDPLIGVKYDMVACRRLFETLFGYQVFPSGDDVRCGKQYWSEYDIIDLFDNAVIDQLINCEGGNKFDGIIVIISTHIDVARNVIYSSDEKAIYLYDIFKKLFDFDYPKLFIIDGKSVRIEEEYIDFKEEKKLEMDEYMQPIMISNDNNHKIESNSLQLIYRDDRNVATDCFCEDDGDSLFIKAVINQFKKYIFIKPYKYKHFTQTLSKILENMQINIDKDGDLSLNELRFMKRNKKYVPEHESASPATATPGGPWLESVDSKENSDDENQITVGGTREALDILHEYSVNTKVVVRVYRDNTDNDKIIGVSKWSMKELRGKIQRNVMYEDLPQNGVIYDIKSDMNNNTLYLIKLEHNEYIWSKLRSIYGKHFYPQLTFGKEIEAKKHRYVRILVMNKSKNDTLQLLLGDDYMDKCNYLIQPKYLKIPANGYHCFFIVGEMDASMGQSKAETGCLGVVKYKVISDDIYENNMIMLCGFKNIDKKNQWKDLEYPLFDCKYIDKDKIKPNVFKKMIKKLNDNKPKTKLRISCKIDDNDNNCIVFVFE